MYRLSEGLAPLRGPSLSPFGGVLRPARTVSVIGGHSATPQQERAARELGGLLASRGFTVVCGGMGGVMAAVCRGAVERGGFTVGLLPVEDPSLANPWVRLPIPTGLGTARNRMVALSGQAVVAVGGRWGTLSEIAFALDAGRPVCAIGGWSSIPGVTAVDGPEEALEFVLNSRDWSEDA